MMVSTGSGSRGQSSKKNLRKDQHESESDLDASDEEYLTKKPTNGHANNRNRQENVLRARGESNFVVSDEKAPSTPPSTSKYSLRTPTSVSKTTSHTSEATSSTSRMNSAQLDVLGRFRARGGTAPVIQSPLALEQDTDFILVKKRKNVTRVDVGIQTDQSYLLTKYKQINKHH